MANREATQTNRAQGKVSSTPGATRSAGATQSGAVKARQSDAKENVSGKKPRRKMKKQVRKTLGGLFLASAVVVAAISMQGYVA